MLVSEKGDKVMYATAAIAAVITIEENEEETEKTEEFFKTEERILIQRCLPLQSIRSTL